MQLAATLFRPGDIEPRVPESPIGEIELVGTCHLRREDFILVPAPAAEGASPARPGDPADLRPFG